MSKRDNPVISGDMKLKENVYFGDLGGGPQYFHQGATFTPDGNLYELHAFDLGAKSGLSHEQKVIAPAVLPGIEISFQPVPRDPGSVTAPLTLPWEVHGLKLGSSNVLTVEVNKIEPDYNLESLFKLEVKIHPETLIIPIQVFRVVSTVPGTTVNDETEHFNPYGAAWYFDDGRVLLNSHTTPFLGQPQRRTFNNFWPHNYKSISDDTRPDDIFLPCGVQFRMVNYQEIQVDNDERVNPTAGNCQCSENGNFWAPMAAANASAAEFSPNFIKGVPYFIIMARYQPGECCESPIIAVGDDGRAVLAGGPLTWAHEIAHAVGLNHVDSDCSHVSSMEINIMCEAKSGRVLTPGQCNTVRFGAKSIIESTPPQFRP